MLSAVVFLAFAISVTSANRFGHGCLPYRERFKLHFPCEEEDKSMQDTLQAWEANLRGEPSEFAKTGYYDRLFRQQNQIAYQGQYAYYPTYGYNANLPEDKPFEIINIAMGSREKVVTLYKTLYFMGKEYPKGKDWFHPRLKTAFLKNKDVRDPEQIDQLVKRGEYVVKELEALYKLKKYRTMKNRYYEVDPP